MYYVYILRCADDSLYTGITTDVERRFQQHLNGTASHYTAAKKAVEIVYTETVESKSDALKREAEIKRLPREKKLQLVETQI